MIFHLYGKTGELSVLHECVPVPALGFDRVMLGLPLGYASGPNTFCMSNTHLLLRQYDFFVFAKVLGRYAPI